MEVLKDLKKDSEYLSDGVEEVQQKLEKLPLESSCDVSTLQNLLTEVNLLHGEIKSKVQGLADNISRQKRLVNQSEAALTNINQQIVAAEKFYEVSILNQCQAISNGFAGMGDTHEVYNDDESITAASENENLNNSADEHELDKLNETEDDLASFYNLLNKSFPKLL